MREGLRRARIGAVAALDIERVRVEPGRQYAIAGVLNAGQGLFKRESIDGSQTNYPTLHRLRSGQLVMRKLTAWEGPITCVPVEYEGFFVSAEFPTFTLGPDLLPAFMTLVCQRPQFWESMKDRSTGSVQRRKRVSPSELLAIEIDLPPLTDQRRIVDLIAAVDTEAFASAAVATAARRSRQSLATSVWSAATDRVALGTLGRTVTGSTPPTAVADYWSDDEIPFFTPGDFGDTQTLTHASRGVSHEGAIAGRLLAPPAVLQVCIGAIGKVAVMEVPGCTNQQVNALTGLDSIDAHALTALLATQQAQDLIWSLAGKTTLPILKKSSWASMEVPWPSRDARAVLANLVASLDSVGAAAQGLRDALARARASLLADLLSDEHEIPATYDRFLDGAA
jgi:type I restriction enzyme S subunit